VAGGFTGPNPLRVLIAPDSFKGSLTSLEVARALQAGWLRARPADEVRLAPLADGGEGTLVAIEAAGGWIRRTADARDPLDRPILADWLCRRDGAAAFIEMARASGLSLVKPGARDAMRAGTHGTGDLLRAVLDAGIRDIALGIGGSATTDGGAGMLRALGANVAVDMTTVDLAGLDPRLAEVRLRVASDVTNPLLGPDGAASVYGPQKGATGDQVGLLDARLARFADALEAATGRRERDTPGAGAAGGLGFGLLCLADRFRELRLAPGIDLVMAQAGFDAALATTDLVITGEGRIDAQTAFGKTALGVARRAQAAGVPCVAVGGGVTPKGVTALAAVGAIAVPVSERPQSVEAAMAAGAAPLERCGERIAQLVGVARTAAVIRPEAVEQAAVEQAAAVEQPSSVEWTKADGLSHTRPMATVNIHEAKTQLSRLLERVQHGEQIVIANAGRPVAMLAPLAAPPRRQPGHDRIVVHDDFDEPLADVAGYAEFASPPREAGR
jgi:glycerate 2-kinase